MPGTVWLHCFFFAIWNFFASPQSCLFGVRGWLVHVGGWYICSDFYACPFLYFQNSSNFTRLSFPSQSKSTLE